MNESIRSPNEVRNVTARASILYIDSGGGEERYAEGIFAFTTKKFLYEIIYDITGIGTTRSPPLPLLRLT